MRVIHIFAPYRFQIILVLLSIIIVMVLELSSPFLISMVLDDAIGKRNIQLLIFLVSIMIVISIVVGLMSVGEAYVSNWVGQSVMRDLRNKLYSHLQRMSLHFFTATRIGEIQSRLSNDVDGVQKVVTSTATSIVSNLALALSTTIGMLILSPLLTAISLGLLPIFLWITHKVGNVRRSTSKETQESMASLTAMMQETLSLGGMLLVKTFGREKYAQECFEVENQRLTNLEVLQQMVGRWFFLFITVFFSIAPAIVYLVAGFQIIHNPVNPMMTLGKIVAFAMLQARLFFPIGQLFTIHVEVQGALALFDRIFEYLDLPVEIQNAPDALYLRPTDVSGAITLKDVSFTYQRNAQDASSLFVSSAGPNGQRVGSDEAVEPAMRGNPTPRATLNHLSFEVRPGQLAALVGPSGAGKTTITYLVPRLYDVESGAVEIDGINVKHIALESLRELIGMVTQETYLFHASVRANLLYARADATEEQMVAAARAAAIHDRIMELEHGYDTVVGERGYRLSGGEKQRIAIARVILKDPRILILDEATSALDTRSEHLIQAALEPLMKERTTLAIAHRLSTILAADVIFVIDQGQIVECGTHEVLLARNGLYAWLYHEQFARNTGMESASAIDSMA